LGTTWFGYELVLGTSWLGYELARYDLVRVRVDWKPSVAYIGTKSRTERPRKTKIGTEVAHITRDSDTSFKVKRARSPGCFTHRHVGTSASCSGGCGNALAVRNCCYVAVCSATHERCFSAHRRGEGRGHIVAAARLQLLKITTVNG